MPLTDDDSRPPLESFGRIEELPNASLPMLLRWDYFITFVFACGENTVFPDIKSICQRAKVYKHRSVHVANVAESSFLILGIAGIKKCSS